MSEKRINFAPASRDASIALQASGRAVQAEQRAVEEANRLAGTISVIGEGDDFYELLAISPAELVEGNETVGGFEIEFIDILTPEM